ncbi:hypothetical protein H1R20_g14780, partial [Candolleomyces eurysporus]
MVATKAALSIRVDALTDADNKSEESANSIGVENRAKLEKRLLDLKNQADYGGVKSQGFGGKKTQKFEMTGQTQTYNTKADVVMEDLVPTQRDSSEREAEAVGKAVKAVLDVKEEKKKAKEAKKAAKKAENRAVAEDVDMAGSDDDDEEAEKKKRKEEKKRKRREAETAGEAGVSAEKEETEEESKARRKAEKKAAKAAAAADASSPKKKKKKTESS